MSRHHAYSGWILLGAGLLAFIPQASRAQIAPSRSGSSSLHSLGIEEYWDAVRAFGRCFVHRTPNDAFALLSTTPGSREETAVLRILLHGDAPCLGDVTRLSFHAPHIRGSFAEGLILNRTPIPPRLAVTAPAAGAPIRTLSEASRCYAATHEAEVRALITGSRPGSDQELAAVQRMAPDFFQCVPAEARGRPLNATDVRYSMAEALLRLGPVAPTSPPR